MKQDSLGSAHSYGEDAEGEGRGQARGGGGRGIGVEPSAGANRETVQLSANNPAAKGQSLKVDVSKQQASPFETKKNSQKQNFANLVHEYQQLAPVPPPPGDAAHLFHQQYQTHAPKVNLQLIESEIPSSGSPQILRQVQNPKMHNPNSTGNSPCQVLSANDEELFNYMPRMQIRLPAQNEDQKEAGDLSPPLDTTSHNVMKRKLESDKAQSQDFKHVNVQTSEHKQSSSSVVQSTADKNKLMNFGKNATETSAPPNDANISPETLNRSAQFYDYRPGDTIQIGAQVLSGAAGVPGHHHISDLNTFAQQLATHKIVLDGNVSGAGGIQGFYGEPIIFSTISQHSHCDHCRHVGKQQGAGEAGQETQKQVGDQKAQLEKGAKLGVLSKKAQNEKNIKTKCTSPQCCLEACPLEKARPRPHELAFIDFSSSIDHTHELEYTYQKYKHVVNKLKQDFINFSQKQPMRKSVTYFEGGGRKKKQGVQEAVSDENARVAAQLDDLIQQIVDNMSSKKRSICDGVPETCAGRCWHSQKQNHQHSDYESMSNSPRASPDPQAERNNANQYHLSPKLPIHHSLDLSKLRPRASTYDRSKTQRSGAHSRIKTDSEYGSNRRGKRRSSCIAVEKMRKTQGSTLKYKRHRRSLSFKRRNRSKAADGQQKYAQKTGSGEYDLRKPHVLLGIDGKSNSRMQKQQSPKGSGKRLSRLGEGFDYKHSPTATRPKMQLNPNMLQKLQQKSSVQNSKPRNREVSARNQDLETIADFDIQQQHLKQHSLKPSFLNRIHLNDANHRGNGGPQPVQTSRPLNFQLDANQPRNFESTKENQDSQMNESQYQQPFNKSQQGSTVGVTPRNQVMAQNTNSSSLPKQFPNPTMPNNTLQNTPTQQITQATIKQPFFNQSFQQKNVDYSEFNYPQQQIGLTLDPQKLNTSRDCTKTPIPAISPTERSDKNKVSGEQRNYHGMGDKGTQNSNAVNNNTFLKEAHKLSHDSEKNITYNDIEKTGTLSDGNEQNRPFDSLHGAQPSKKDFILQMEAINFHNAGSEAAKNSILNNRESEMRDQQILAPKLQNERVTFTTEIAKQQIKFPLEGEDDITGQTNAGKGFTNTLKKKITMPFNHFVHPSQKNDQITVVERQLPPGRIKLQIKSNYRSTIDRELQLDQTLHASELSFKEHSQLLYQGSFQQNQQDAQVVQEESTNLGRKPMLQSSIPKISHFDKLPGRNRNHKHVHLIHAAHPPHMSRTNSTSKRELSSTRPIAKVAAAAAAAGEPSALSESDPAKQMQMPSLINASNSRIVVLGETMPDRFKNRGIADRISKAIEGQKEQEKKIVEKSGAREEEEDSQVRIQLNLNSCPTNENHQRTQKKDQSWANSNLKTKKVQFRVDMKSRSISKTDVKYRNKADSRQQSLSNIDPNTLIDPVTMSFEKKLEEGSATRRAAGPDKQVALRELHAKCSNSLNSSELKQQSSVQKQSKFNEPVAMKTKTNFMKKIKIGGNNEALRQMLDYNVKMQALQQEHQRMQNFIFGNLDPEYRESSLKSQTGSYLKNIGSDGLEVIFQSASQNDQFDPQMDRTLKLILQQNNSGTSPELLFSPGTDNRDHDIDHELAKYDDMLASIHTVNQHDQSKKKHHELFSHSVAKLNLQNSMIKRIIKRDQNTCGNMSPPSDTYNPSADHRLKTMNFDRLEKRIKDGSGACIAPYQSNLNETLKQKDLQHQRANTCESEQVVAQPKQTKLQTYQQNHTQNIPTDQEYIWQMQRELQKKKVSNQIGSSLVQTAEREKKDFMNLDIIEQGSRQSRKGSEHPMKTGRNLKSESGLENVKFKSIDIQVQSHRTRVKRNQHTPENQQVMSCLDREETIQELLAIEQQLAQLLKNPNNISTRKYRRVPREQLLNTLRQYVFEQSFRNSKARNPNQSQDQRQKSPFPHDFMEIIGSAAKIKKQRHIQRLHNNRMEFIKNIEYLGQNKKHTENKFWHLGRHQTISEAVRKDRKQRTTSLDFDNFDKLIRQIDIEQKQIKGRQMEAARARGQVLVVKPKRSSNENHTVSLTPTTSNLHHDLQNTFTESKPEIGIATNIANHRLLPSTLHNSQDDPLVQITNRSYLLHQPKNHMKKYANQHLLNYDHIFLNEEQIIKSNMFSENFYRIRESNKIANHLDVIENKLIQKMKEIKLDEQEKRQALVEAGVLDFDVKEAAAIINDKRRESVTAAESKVVHSKAIEQRQVHVSQIVKPLKVSVKDALGSQQYSLMQKTPLIGTEKELLTPGSEGQQPKQKDPPIQIHSDKQRSNQTRQITTENYEKEQIYLEMYAQLLA